LGHTPASRALPEHQGRKPHIREESAYLRSGVDEHELSEATRAKHTGGVDQSEKDRCPRTDIGD
jgi:hypothetical protein